MMVLGWVPRRVLVVWKALGGPHAQKSASFSMSGHIWGQQSRERHRKTGVMPDSLHFPINYGGECGKPPLYVS